MIQRSLLSLICVFLLTTSARAQGMVQIVFEGSIQTEGGARVELDMAFEAQDASGSAHDERVELGLHLAQKTNAADVAALLANELARRGARVIASDPASHETTRANLFVERVYIVGLRLGRGLNAQVCLSDSSPALVRFLPPKEVKDAAHFALSASTEHPHTKDRVRFELAVDFKSTHSGEQAADILTTASIKNGWPAEWANHEAWRPENLQSGARVTGTCLTLTSSGDWRIEVELERAVPR